MKTIRVTAIGKIVKVEDEMYLTYQNKIVRCYVESQAYIFIEEILDKIREFSFKVFHLSDTHRFAIVTYYQNIDNIPAGIVKFFDGVNKNTILDLFDANKPQPTLCQNLNESAKRIHQIAKAKGFWDSERNVGELLMLVTSELGEAMEAHRKGKFANTERIDSEIRENQMCENNSIRLNGSFVEDIKDSFEDEIADTIIRLLDLCAGLGINIEKHINLKVAYNATRPRLHGKKY